MDNLFPEVHDFGHIEPLFRPSRDQDLATEAQDWYAYWETEYVSGMFNGSFPDFCRNIGRPELIYYYKEDKV